MAGHRFSAGWMLALSAAAAFVVGASAQEGARAIRGVVTPDTPIWAQDPQTTPPPQQEETTGRAGRGGNQAPAPRPYGQVITSAAKTDEGIFKVHRVGDTLYYEIPKAELNKDYLWVTQLKKTTIGVGYGGQAAGSRVVRWVQKGDRVLLQNIDYSIIADPSTPIAAAVDDANYPAIIRTFNVAAYAPSGDPVIDVTPLFMTDVPEFSVRTRVGGRGFDATRSFIEKAVSFPQNINVEVTQTFTGNTDRSGRGWPRTRGRARDRHARRLGHGAHLPQHGQAAREADDAAPVRRARRLLHAGHDRLRQRGARVGRQSASSRGIASRRRIPNAAMSEPVKPIVYYIDPATPTKWVPYLKQGIEDWQPAFEAAGFRNAIHREGSAARTIRTGAPEDVRYSVVRWLPSTTENASGPNVHDPRTGEILEADIQFYHNVQNLTRRTGTSCRSVRSIRARRNCRCPTI